MLHCFKLFCFVKPSFDEKFDWKRDIAILNHKASFYDNSMKHQTTSEYIAKVSCPASQVVMTNDQNE